MSYPLEPPRLGWGRNCVSLGTLSTLESPLLRRQRATPSSRCGISSMVHRRGDSTAEMGAVGRLKCNAWRKGCGGMDATPQSHVKSTKKSIQRSQRGYVLSDIAGGSAWHGPPPKKVQVGRLIDQFTLARSPFFGFSRRVPGSTQFLQEVLAKC